MWTLLRGRKLCAAILLACSIGITEVGLAEPAAEPAAEQQEQAQAQGKIHWEEENGSAVEAVGMGLPPERAGKRGAAMARRAAIVDAYRNLAETIDGVQVSAETTMENLIVTDDVVKAKVAALVKGARIVEEGTMPDGSYFVKMRVPLYGANSVAAIALPEVAKTVEKEAFPNVSQENAADIVALLPSAPYSGVIVDAQGLGLQPTFSPVIFDTNGRAVYGIQKIDYQYAIEHGMVGYTSGAAAAAKAAAGNSRAGANPLIVKAIALQKNAGHNGCNVVVSVRDADRILAAHEQSGFLDQCAVVFER